MRKIKNFFSTFFKNKVFWICFGFTALALIIIWCIFAKNDPSGKVSVFSISAAIARFVGLFVMIALGLLLGHIKVKGISFGTAGVFLVALGVGAAFASIDPNTPFIGQFVLVQSDISTYSDALQNLGLILFASAVGFIAGPTFFRSFKDNAKAFITMGISVTLVGILSAVLIAFIPNVSPYFAAGIFSGAITSTPALAAAQEVAVSMGGDTANTMVTIGYAITYPLGVLGVVLFIQLMPKILKVDMSEERGRLIVKALKDEAKDEKIEEERVRKSFIKNYFEVDAFGITPFAIAVVIGLLIGAITIPLTPDGFGGPCFSLGTTGGCLLSCIIFGHFGHVGRMSFKVPLEVNKTFREFGLAVFLAGIGVVGGFQLVNSIQSGTGDITGPLIAIGIALGVVVTVIPMVLGYYMGKYLFKLPLLNNLGAITGSMTSTPALGALIDMAKTDDVATAYASSFPIATILTAIGVNIYLTFAAQFMR